MKRYKNVYVFFSRKGKVFFFNLQKGLALLGQRGGGEAHIWSKVRGASQPEGTRKKEQATTSTWEPVLRSLHIAQQKSLSVKDT